MSVAVDEISPEFTRIFDVFRYLFLHPLETMVYRWNWKAAVLSALLRSPIFFTAYLLQKQGLLIALGAMLAQFVFRTLFGGVNGSIIQAFRKVEPAWHAVLTIPLVLATFSHVVEFIVQSGYDAVTGTHGKTKAILFSILISVVSAVFNLFAMRRGALLVKDESRQSFGRDLIRMPWLIFEFISFPLVWTYRRKKARSANSSLAQEAEDEEF
jgi:hypothetical protein